MRIGQHDAIAADDEAGAFAADRAARRRTTAKGRGAAKAAQKLGQVFGVKRHRGAIGTLIRRVALDGNVDHRRAMNGGDLSEIGQRRRHRLFGSRTRRNNGRHSIGMGRRTERCNTSGGGGQSESKRSGHRFKPECGQCSAVRFHEFSV